MIRRGSRTSRMLAVAVVAAPAALAAGGFALWSVGTWISTGRALAAQEQLRHEAETRASHASFYTELGEAWRDYSETEISGLAQEPTAEAAEQAMKQRLLQLFERSEGAASVVEILERDDADGVERLRAETRGRLPEAALVSFLETLETQPPFLFVDLMELQPETDGAGRSGLSQVAIRLRVSAYRIKEANR
ncbi:MAG: type II secretion system protein GspM [Pseudomonadota bacterium]